MAEATPAQVEEPAAEVAATRAGSTVLLGIMAAVFMVAAEARVIAPVLPALANEFETTVARAGVLITAYTIPYGLFQLVYGPLADRFSRQRVIGVALGLFALGTFFSGFAPSMLVLDLLRFFTGAAGAGVIPVALAYVGDAVPYGERQAALGRVVSIASLGGVLSATLGGVVATFLDWRAIFIVYGILALFVSGAMLRLPIHRVRAGAARPKGILGPYRAVFERAGSRAVALYLLVFVEGFVATSTFGYLGAFLFERDGLSYAAIGGLLTISGVASMLTGRIVGHLVRRVEERGMLVTGGTMLVVAYGLMGLRPMLLFFPIAMVLAGSGFVIAHSTLQARATELVPELRGTTVALFAFSLFIGGGLGTYVAGLAIEGYGYGATIYGTAALLALFTALSWPLLRVIHGARER
ncbi:MAG TPA: MFS transporter [Herpetosiphonaceae bacterium]|nr:MFS transporter [Herpetosiphonaceae bacterium]